MRLLPHDPRTRRDMLLVAGGLAVLLQGLYVAALLEPDSRLLTRIGLVVWLPHVLLGLVLCDRRPDLRLGPLMVLFGVTFSLPSLNATDNALLWTLGQFYDVSTALLVYVVLAFPYGRLPDLPSKVLAGAVAVGNVSFDVITVMIIDPVRFGCAECPRNLLLVSHQQRLAEVMVDDVAPVLALLTSLTGVLLVVRYVRGTRRLRRALAPVLPMALAYFAVSFVFFVRRLSVDFLDDDFFARTIGYVVDFSLMLLPVGIIVGLLRGRGRRQVKVGDLVLALSDVPSVDRLQAAVSRALGDPSVTVGLWRPDVAAYLDVHGRPLDPPPRGTGRAASYLTRGDEPLAVVLHDEALLDDPTLVASVSAAVRLAVENDRLQEELLQQLREVQASRTRIVEAAYAERRRLERDLHDGAQQRLVSTALALRLARGSLTDPAAQEQVDAALAELQGAISELRDLARGMYPAVLSDEGLLAAVHSLADRCPVPVALRSSLPARLDPAVEAAAYFVVAEALTNVAKYAGARRVDLAVECAGPDLVVTVVDDGRGGAIARPGGGLAGLRDRLNALDGRLDLAEVPGGGTRLVATLPAGPPAVPDQRQPGVALHR